MRTGLQTSQLWPQLRAERQDADHQTSGCTLSTEHDSSLTHRGKLRFMVYDGALNAGIFLRFLKRLVWGAQRKIFLVVDNLRPHRAKIVAAWVAANLDKIELVYLPPYAPEHNPDEFVNNDVKQAMARRQAPKDKAELKKGLTSYMRGLAERPAKIRAFFQAPTVRYAA